MFIRSCVFLALWGCLVVLAACESMQTRSDYDRSQDFSGYRTFAWVDDEPFIAPAEQRERVSPLNRRRIAEAIAAELESKGLRQVPVGANADFFVSYTVGARDRVDVNSYPTAYHHPWGWGWPYYGSEVDVFDGKTRQPVWHGWATKRITQSDIENAAQQIKVAVKSILDSFPPPASGRKAA